MLQWLLTFIVDPIFPSNSGFIVSENVDPTAVTKGSFIF